MTSYARVDDLLRVFVAKLDRFDVVSFRNDKVQEAPALLIYSVDR